MAYTSAGLIIGGTLMSAKGQMDAGAAAAKQGAQEQAAANYQGAILDQQAGQTQASSQLQAVNTRRQAGLVNSRAQAVAAASGAGATDPTVLGVQGQITREGEYSALTSLFNGEEQARGLESQAALTRYSGRARAEAGQARQSAAQYQAFGTILQGGGSLYTKYGPMGGPPPPPANANPFGTQVDAYAMGGYGT